MPMVRDARVTGPISRAVCHHEPVRAVDSISLPTFIELLKNHPLVREKKVIIIVLTEISRIRSGFRLSLRLRWRKSLENRARVFESVQVETYPLPHRSATVIHRSE